MTRVSSRRIVALAALIAGLGCAAIVPPALGADRGGGKATKLLAGAATADITPPVGTPMFAYTARSGVANPPRALQIVADPDENLYAKSFEPSDGIHTRLRASAIVVERGGEKLALVQADLGGVPYALVQAVLDRIPDTGIAHENFLLSATHTHSATGPIWPADSTGYSALGGDLFDPRIFQITADAIAEAVARADERLAPASVGVGRSELLGASANRNLAPYRRNPDVDQSEGEGEAINPELTVIRVDRANGEPLGLWSNFAVHQTSFGDGNLLFSGDNAATTERLVESRIGAESGQPVRPGAPGEAKGPVLVWTNGAEGDVRPDGGSRAPDGLAGEPLEYTPTAAAGANLAGRRVAAGVLDAWRDAGAAMSPEVELGSERTTILLDGTEADGEPVGPHAVLGAGGIVAEDGTCAPVENLAGPGQGWKMPALAGAGLVPQFAPISITRLGPLGITSFPFEITTQMGRRITGAVEGDAGGRLDSAVIAGLTNGYLSYTSTPQEYDACHYEGSFTLFGRREGPRLRDAALSLLPAVLDGETPPSGAPEPPPLAIGTPNTEPLQPTPEAGTATAQPSDVVRRYERATFTWKGGDPGVDAPRGRTFVFLQRREGSRWQTVGTEDGPEDTTAWNDSNATWTETWQFSECDPLGTYRFVASGRAIEAPGAAPTPYEVRSEPFELRPTPPLEIIDATVMDGTARVRARYPNPGAALLALPRRVRDGSATISLADGGEVVAEPDAERLAFEAAVPAGAEIAAVRVNDACGNTTG